MNRSMRPFNLLAQPSFLCIMSAEENISQTGRTMRPRHLYVCAMLLQVRAINGQKTIRVLENTVGPETFGVVGGATLVKGDVIGTSDVVLEGFAVCARFKVAILK